MFPQWREKIYKTGQAEHNYAERRSVEWSYDDLPYQHSMVELRILLQEGVYSEVNFHFFLYAPRLEIILITIWRTTWK